MILKMQYRKLYDDDASTKWRRWKGSSYLDLDNAKKAKYALESYNPNWGIDIEDSILRMWKYEFRITDRSFNPILFSE